MRGVRLALLVAALIFTALTAAGVSRLGVFYEEVVPYVFVPLDIARRIEPGPPPRVEYADHRERDPRGERRFVASDELPRLAVQTGPSRRYPVLDQIYMTNHVSYGGALLARVVGGRDPVYPIRAFHALFGLLALLLLYDVGARLISPRVGALAALLAACSPNFVFMFCWARFDESLPSVAALAALAAAVRHHHDSRPRWLLLAALAAGVGVSAKITTLWPLAALWLAAWVAGVHPRARPRTWLLAALVFAVWMVPMAAHWLLAPASPASREAARRLGFVSDLLHTDALARTARNLVAYLGGWAALLGEIVRGGDARPSPLGCGVVLATLAHLAIAAARPGRLARRARLETAMLVVVAVLFALVALFYREHGDYQFVLLVPFFSLAVALALDATAARLASAPGAALAALALLPLGAQAYDQARMLGTLGHARNAMLDLRAQRASAAYLATHGIARPITVTFYAVGQYELLTRDAVRPLHAFPVFRRERAPDQLALRRVWRRLLELDAARTRYVLLPRGRNVVEARHFDEAAIRAAFLAQLALEPGGGARVAEFANRDGEPLLELYALAPRPAGRTVTEPAEEPPPGAGPPPVVREVAASEATRAALGGLAPGAPVGAFTVESIDEPRAGAVRIVARRGAVRAEFDVRLDDPSSPAPPARAGRYAVYYRQPDDPRSVSVEQLRAAAEAIAQRAASARTVVPGLTALPAR